MYFGMGYIDKDLTVGPENPAGSGNSEHPNPY